MRRINLPMLSPAWAIVETTWTPADVVICVVEGECSEARLKSGRELAVKIKRKEGGKKREEK
jgi:hypothetical protein